MRNTKIRKMILCALFAALTAVLSQIAIPLGPVPLNMATLSVLLSGALLGAKAGCISQAVYVFLGALGAPVFSMFRGGLNVIAGPTGGYIAGYIVAAWLVGFIIERAEGGENKTAALALAAAAGVLAYMLLGTLWYMQSTNTPLLESLVACVLPFLPGDMLKILAATLLAKRLRPALSLES